MARWAILGSFLVAFLAPPAFAQSPDSTVSARAPQWNLSLFAGLTRSVDEDPLPATFGAGIGLRRRLGAKTGIALEAAYLPIGPRSEFRPLLGLGTYTRDRSQKVLRLGLTADFGLARGPFRPTLLLGASVTRIHNSDHSLIVDTAGTVLLKGDEERTRWGIGPALGFGIGLPRIGGLLTPLLEFRAHGIAIKSEDGWGGYTFATLGITLIH